MLILETIIAIIIAYLFGSISSAIIVCKLMGLPDPRSTGSHNPGASNVLRIGGKVAALFTLLGDMLKGVLPVLIAKWYGLPLSIQAGVALAAVLGHLLPIFFRFEGGKGVATAIGSLLAMTWQAGLCWLITWCIIAIIFRYASLASIIASLLAPFYLWYFTHDSYATIMMSFMSLIIIYRHLSNIKNLMIGKEHKIGIEKVS